MEFLLVVLYQAVAAFLFSAFFAFSGLPPTLCFFLSFSFFSVLFFSCCLPTLFSFLFFAAFFFAASRNFFLGLQMGINLVHQGGKGLLACCHAFFSFALLPALFLLHQDSHVSSSKLFWSHNLVHYGLHALHCTN
jgi:hypothetical protein